MSPSSASDRFCQSFPLCAPRNEIILPGQFLDAVLPEDLPPDTEVTLEPRWDSKTPDWPPPQIASPVASHLRLINDTPSPIAEKKHAHIATVNTTCSPTTSTATPSPVVPDSARHLGSPRVSKQDLLAISVDPDDILSGEIRQAFVSLHTKFADVFDTSVGCYNDQSGRIRAVCARNFKNGSQEGQFSRICAQFTH